MAHLARESVSLRVGSEIKSLTPPHLQFTFCSGLAVKEASAQLSASVAVPVARPPTTMDSNSPETKAQINFPLLVVLAKVCPHNNRKATNRLGEIARSGCAGRKNSSRN